jgi:hypothetical protein
VQELIGWRNREGLPVINGHTTKILRFFGSKDSLKKVHAHQA